MPTDASDGAVVDRFYENDCVVELQSGGVGLEFIGDSRRMALSLALEEGRGHIHIVDMDRILQWAGSHPQELRGVVRHLPQHDFLVIGRTERAMETHPQSQRETEGLANRVCSLLLGSAMDVTSASRGLSPEAARLILRHSRATECNTDSEWPLIIHCLSDMPVGYIEVEGLKFEDWLKRTDEVERAGGVEAWKRFIDEDPAAWLHRIRFAEGIVETAISTYRELCGSA
ncbi:MAG: hypothetical protein JSV18_02145 [Candidatus Bathyarchaeota archaeon]|nr:MAG: hypothetical protein JSV18_02145 [Candidatus Bathyarchaeota archaeon]